ncbi:MAG: branched-chain amino acid ABC transporter substrate-binding protein [Caldilineaceae bacterium]
MKHLHKAFSIVSLLVVLALVSAACQPVTPNQAAQPAAPAAASGSKTIKIGLMSPLTGGAAFLGQEQKGFAKVALDIFNERTGLKVEMVEGDTELNPDTAKTVADRMVSDSDIVVVVGPAGSQECEATKPIFAKAGLAHLTHSCTRTDLTAKDKVTPTFFRPIPRDADQSKTDAAFMLNTLKVKSAYLVDDQSSYATGLDDELAAALKAGGVTDIQRASVKNDDTDFSSLVTQIIDAKSDVVFFPGQIGNQLSTLATQLSEQGFKGTYFLADAGFSPDVLKAGGKALEGAYVSVFSPDPAQVPDAKDYTDRYAKEFNKDFGAFGGASALTTYVALDAVERCSKAGAVTRQCVIDMLKTTKLDKTPLGVPISFDENNQVANSKFFLFQVKDGKFTAVNQ